MDNVILEALIKQIWHDFVVGRNDLDKVMWSDNEILDYLTSNKKTLKNLTQEMVKALEDGDTLELDFVREYLYDVLNTDEFLDDEDDTEDSEEMRQESLNRKQANLDNFITLALSRLS